MSLTREEAEALAQTKDLFQHWSVGLYPFNMIKGTVQCLTLLRGEYVDKINWGYSADEAEKKIKSRYEHLGERQADLLVEVAKDEKIPHDATVFSSERSGANALAFYDCVQTLMYMAQVQDRLREAGL